MQNNRYQYQDQDHCPGFDGRFGDQRFDDAIWGSRLSADDLPDFAVQMRRLSRNYYIGAMAFAVTAIVMASLFPGHHYMLIGLVFGVLIGYQGWWAAFRHWQVCHRRLGGLVDFIRSPRWWVPGPMQTARVYVDHFKSDHSSSPPAN